MRLGDIEPTVSPRPVYRRPNGETWVMLNERFHVRTKLDEVRSVWIGDGIAEEFDPQELVEIIQ